ncbi:MAG: hypothetical protein NTX82_01280 [Candidatus Parcubacteria bacterium]|nr:hypothetical protein [Candidatus Parcubacteria bacterium]
MKKVIIIIVIILILAGVGCFFVWQKVASYFTLSGEAEANKKQEQQIQGMIDERRKQSLTGDDSGGIEYGVKQIEKILGQKADYMVFMGFSQAMGIFRQLDLPAEETMQWLRVRQGYAIGEPQRARNHSTFIKQMIAKYSPELNSKKNLALGYLVFKLLRTDLTMNQARKIAEEAVKFDLSNHPERIQLLMRPAYDVKDISYEPEKLNENIDKLIKPIAKIIPEGAYSGDSLEEIQKRLLENIQNGMDDPEFIRWAFTNYVWLQIEDETERENKHFEIMQKYVELLTDADEKNSVITDYIIEMEDLGKADWAAKGKELLKANTPDQQ